MFKQACRTISNIIVGTRARIQTVFDANIIPYLVQSLQHAEFDVKKEAAWAIFYVTSGGSHEHISVDRTLGEALLCFKVGLTVSLVAGCVQQEKPHLFTFDQSSNVLETKLYLHFTTEKA
ncbi:hypothetical protein JHK84_054343 [Glycine max]|nr:hypothetical protein JHK86_054324 [Glycine max]KAG5084305.1 hypothetical protein JHK84_054343 [Glycine max]